MARVSTLCLGIGLVAVVWAGCSSTRTSDTARTGIEQLLISTAVDQTLDHLPLPPVEGRKVFLDTQFLDAVDKGYLVGTLRQRLLLAGAKLTDAKEGSEITIEVCSGGLGTDNTSAYVGVPAITLPMPLPVSTPEIRLFERTNHYGTAKICMTAYYTETGELIYDSGRALARSDDSRWAVMGIGPFTQGTMQQELKQRHRRFPQARERNRDDATVYR